MSPSTFRRRPPHHREHTTLLSCGDCVHGVRSFQGTHEPMHAYDAEAMVHLLESHVKKRNQIGSHALLQGGFGLSTLSGAERKGTMPSDTRHRRQRESRQRATHEPRSRIAPPNTSFPRNCTCNCNVNVNVNGGQGFTIKLHLRGLFSTIAFSCGKRWFAAVFGQLLASNALRTGTGQPLIVESS
jgi:hypothetical protein